MTHASPGSRLLPVLAGIVLVAATARPARAEQAGDPARRVDLDLDEVLARGERSLTLEEAVARALETAPDLDRARAAVAVARAGVRSASVGFVPRLDLTARYLHLGGFEDGSVSIGGGDIPVEQALSLAGSIEDPAARLLLTSIVEQQAGMTEVTFETPRDQIGFRAALTVPVSDLFLTILPAYRAARGRVDIEEERLAAARADVALAAEEAYLRYAQARGALAVAEASLVLAEEHRDRVAAVSTAGLGREADRLAAEARVAAVRTAVARARGGVALARTALITVLHLEDDGRDFAVASVLEGELPAAPPEVDDALVARAWSARPEVAALERLVGVHEQAERAARGAHLPHLLVVAGADVADPNQRVIPPEDELIPSWEVGAVLTWSPSDSIAADARGREARARQDAAEADLARLRDGIRLQLRRAREDYLAARAVMDAARERLTAARAAYDARRAELDAGRAVTTQLLDAELELTRARLDLVGAAVDLRIADARFRRAMGEP